MQSAPQFSISNFGALLILLAGVIVYANSLSGEFVFDDRRWIETEQNIRSVDRLPALVAGATRPVWKLSLAANYLYGGLDVTGYHVVNGIIHVLAGLALFGICRRTLRRPAVHARYRDSADGIAFAIALLWTVHPLQTESVTYIVQRCESLMGLMLLASLYGSIRDFEASPSRLRPWAIFSVVTCAIGMATKEVMVVAPLLVWLHDRSFLSGTGPSALLRRKGFFVFLAACWAIPFGLIGVEALFFGEMARPDIETVGRLEYLLTQPAILLHYVRLSLWPEPLVFSYGWPAAQLWSEILPALLVILASVVIGGWAVWRNRPWGYLLVWFFAILAPTSSIQPIEDLAVEHRMYLPLAAVIVAVVLAVYWATRASAKPWTAPALLLVATLLLGGLTIRRNSDYHTELRLWETVTIANPNHARGHYNYGTELRRVGRNEEAIVALRRASELDPTDGNARNNLANAVLALEGPEAAVPLYLEAIANDPSHPESHLNLGNALLRSGDPQTAEFHYRKASELRGGFTAAKYGIANALEHQGESERAIAAYRVLLTTSSRFAPAHLQLGQLLHANGELELAQGHIAAAIQLRPTHARTWLSASALRVDQGRIEEAIQLIQNSLKLDPNSVPAQERLKELLALLDQGEAANPDEPQ